MNWHLFLGGPADGMKMEVAAGVNHVDWPEPVTDFATMVRAQDDMPALMMGSRSFTYMKMTLRPDDAPERGMEIFVPVGRSARWAIARLIDKYTASVEQLNEIRETVSRPERSST